MSLIKKITNNILLNRIKRFLLLKTGIYVRVKRLTPTVSEDLRVVTLLNKYKIDTVLDIGGNTGQFAESLLDFNYQGNIVSFEPVLANYNALQTRSKQYSNWSIAERCAIGDINGTIDINVSESTDFSSIKAIKDSYVKGNESSKTITTEQVNIYTLDSLAGKYFNKNNRILLKIDTQGYEEEVLKGAKELLKYVVGVKLEVPLSVSNSLYENVKMDIYDYFDFFKSHGFECVSIEPISVERNTGKMYEVDVVFMKVNGNL